MYLPLREPPTPVYLRVIKVGMVDDKRANLKKRARERPNSGEIKGAGINGG